MDRAGLDLVIPDLDSFEKRLALTVDASGKGKRKVVATETSKTISQKGDDLNRNLVYVNPKSGKKHLVKRLDCSYKYTPIATCLLDGVVLDGDHKDLDGKDLAENLRVMDLAHYLLLAGYQKLKQMVQINESEKGELEKVKDELAHVRDVQVAEKKKLDALKRLYNDAALEKLTMSDSIAELEEKVAYVTECTKTCKAVAQRAQQAYNSLGQDFNELEQMYFQLKEELESGAPYTLVIDVPGDASNVPSASTVVPPEQTKDAVNTLSTVVPPVDVDGDAATPDELDLL